ncbi:hypothetical protein QI297_09705 [Staphylococcus saprophyticus]|nr:hypothetical protein [Staphylococcus saprophyticus]
MRRKVNNSETHEIKRYYKVPSEKVQEWSDTIENLTKQSDQFKAERDTLIDDLSWYKAKVSRLERENRDLKHENKALRLQSNTYFDEWQESEKQRNEFISYINLYTTLTNHIRLKAENNPGVSRYIDLVNYIDRLERD